MKKRGRGRKEREVGRKRQPVRQKAIKDVLRFSCVSMPHTTETEQQQPEANNATLVTLMLTTNDMFEVFFLRIHCVIILVE